MGNKKAKKTLALPIILILTAVLAALVLADFIGKPPEETVKFSVGMGTVITQKLYADTDASRQCEEIDEIISELENKISWRIENSDAYLLNKNGVIVCDDEMKEIIKACGDVYSSSDGAFDITVGKLTSLWKIGQEDAYLPTDEEISQALEFVDGSDVELVGDKACLGKGQFVDFGAVGKGLACDKIRQYLQTTEVSSAVISVGGSVLLYGEGEVRTVAIRDPRASADEYMGTLSLSNCCVSTSGDYERVLVKDGKAYHHILDPVTGYPAQSGLISVTVVCESGLMSDALSTACFILGKDRGEALLEEYNAQGIFIDGDLNVYVTQGLSESFTLTNEKYSLSGETQ